MSTEKDFKKGKYITLDNGKGYCIVSDVIYDNDKYLFLINPDNVKEQYYAQLELVDDNINILLFYFNTFHYFCILIFLYNSLYFFNLSICSLNESLLHL